MSTKSKAQSPVNDATQNQPELPMLLGMDVAELSQLASGFGEPAYRGEQLYGWLYRSGAADFSQMGNLPASFIGALQTRFRIGRSAPVRVDESADGTRKYLFRSGGSRFIEAAYIPEGRRATLCLSSQVGCRMGCVFCATGHQGYQGNLSAGEILNQYMSLPERESVTNIVYMGMGEPFDNTAEVMRSLALFGAPRGLSFGARRITVSTVGVLPGMREFLQRGRAHLAISIHSPFDEERRSLMPVQRLYPIGEVLQELRIHDWGKDRRLSFEYVMFSGVNNDVRHARQLVRLLAGLRCRVNLIRYHAVPGTRLASSDRTAMEAFQAILKEKGLTCTIRRSRGEDVQAACGLLSTRELVRSKAEDC